MAIAGKIAALYASDPNILPSPFVNESMTAIDGTNKIFQIDNTSKLFWSPDIPISIQVDGKVPTIPFAIEEAHGTVVFEKAVTGKVTASGSSLSITQVGGSSKWSLDIKMDVSDATTFASEGWREFLATLKGWTANSDKFWTVEDDLISDGGTPPKYRPRWFDSFVLVVLFFDAPASIALVGFAQCSGQTITAPVEGLITAPIQMTGQGGIFLEKDIPKFDRGVSHGNSTTTLNSSEESTRE